MVSRKGQVAVYLILVLVAMFLMALVGVDTFLAVRSKNRLQNGGDAAALAAARRQGSIINEIGMLNMAHIEAALKGDRKKCEGIELDQRRLALLEPVYALAKANEAAKMNGMPARREFSEILMRHAKDVRTIYSGGTDSGDPYPESYPGAWSDYAAAIENVVEEGLATGPDNIEFHDAAGGHILLLRDFYQAVAGQDWCWFLFNCDGLLDKYVSFRSWAPLSSAMGATENSEIFSLHLEARKCALTDTFTKKEIVELASRYCGMKIGEDDVDRALLASDPEQTWFFFNAHDWSAWFDGRRIAPQSDFEEVSPEFPVVGGIKQIYNVRGCAAVCRTGQTVETFATDSAHDFSWCAAAKPFGTVDDFEGRPAQVTALRGFVAPCMEDVRLIPIDAAGAANLATADFAWVVHVRDHLQKYLARGPDRDSLCWYCMQLEAWENPVFRSKGRNWLRFHSGECIRPLPGGPWAQGGTSHGH